MKEQSQFWSRIFVWNSAFIVLFLVVILWIRLLKNLIGTEVAVVLVIVFGVLFILYCISWFEYKMHDLVKTNEPEPKFELVTKNVIKYSWSLAIEGEMEREEIDEERYNQLLESGDYNKIEKRKWIIIREVEK